MESNIYTIPEDLKELAEKEGIAVGPDTGCDYYRTFLQMFLKQQKGNGSATMLSEGFNK